MSKKLGLIVNPIAGIGGRAGLKGSNGPGTVNLALGLGSTPAAPRRAVEALRRVALIKQEVNLITCPLDMGEEECAQCSLDVSVVGSVRRGHTTAEDTKGFAREMLRLQVDLLLVAGGDGTARDIYEAIGDKLTVLGIPAGVKIHSGIYATNPSRAGDLAVMFLRGNAQVQEAEVMDVDEDAFRHDKVSARLLGYLRVPYEQTMVQGPKVGSSSGEESSAKEIALELLDSTEDDCMYIVGPGTTTRPILEELGLHKTLLGVDVVCNRQLIASDVNAFELLKLTSGRRAKIIVTVIGGQGFIFGRGSQQISPEVIERVGRENLIVVATPNKLASLMGRPLLVDTGELKTDQMLSGYMRVTTGYRRSTICLVKAG